ncbi:Threonylcarbamoyl-AMP synthase (modular protein) [Candidatus Nitrosocosmicus franklandus]|uniref:L-threonylcarbamoyladenylate synthase n=1 Tax=Candidatus Nitrosocosmicus franklandianus TaxID=1798806 RepID=A0A484IA19_9ARCH|nr:Threonylcarbamoyl-AMP synthase (modular protein) [Candidatus Nitrosocosmicus franklandus]
MVITLDCSCTNELSKCAKIIDEGGIVIFPTDTVYGIGCDPTNELAVLKLFKLKNRPMNKTLPLLTFSQSMVTKVAQISKPAKILMDKFWPGQLTLVLNSHTDNIGSGNVRFSKYVVDSVNQSIALRVPGSQCTRDIIGATKTKFLVGTSANISKEPSPENLGELDMRLVSKCDALVYDKTRLGTPPGYFVSICEGRLPQEIQATTAGKGLAEGTSLNYPNQRLFSVDARLTRSNSLLGEVSTSTTSAAPATPSSIVAARESQAIKISRMESTIVDLTHDNQPKIIREGSVPKDKIIEVLKAIGKVRL